MRARSNLALRIVLLGIVAVMLTPTAAHASCVIPPPMRRAIADAPAAFVGTVTGARFNDRWVTVSIVEIWAGENVPPSVEVRSGAGSSNAVTSVDRSYKIGETYLFIPFEQDGSVFRDNVCTNTTVFTESVAEFRPASVSTPAPSDPVLATPTELPPPIEPTGEERTWGWAVPALFLGAIALVYAAWRITRKP